MIPERKTKYPAEGTSRVLEPQPAHFRKKKQLETALQVSYNIPVQGFQPSRNKKVWFKVS